MHIILVKYIFKNQVKSQMTKFNIRNPYILRRALQTKCHNTQEKLTKSSENLSYNVRQKFLDYFIKENNHKYVRSSPVMPYCDPTVAFVNAGMNQFKSIFLGQQNALHKKVTNSQKCVRVGGKHNDLNVVGSDGYHHTFFEMLGNWSFDDYFKKEACEMAWNLLVGPYGLQPSSLYVTYFGGDSKMNLEPDLECRDIWRSIGVSEEHILPFGTAENFWEMGLIGPCGPCTEIHIDHRNKLNRSCDVNRNVADLTELWNIVFIQYNRNIEGRIELLPKQHIDTGMGLERLTAILQGKSSNYDTDIFSNLFEIIQKNCKGLPAYRGTFGVDDKNGIDTAYRILADHSRMVTACLSDGIIPEENQKLRRVLRKTMLLSETIFKQETGLLNKLVPAVAHNLGDVYPEMGIKINQVLDIILYEEEIYKSIRSTATNEWCEILEKEPNLRKLNVLEMPGLVAAYNELTSLNLNEVTSQLAFKLYDTYGLDETTIKSLSDALHLKLVVNDLKNELNIMKMKTKNSVVLNDELSKTMQNIRRTGVNKTDDQFKYNYQKINNAYKFDNVDCKVLSIIKNANVVYEIEPNAECYLILNKTNFYTEAGGQTSDKGRIKFSDNKIFDVSETQNIKEYILHKGVLKSEENLQVGDGGQIFIDEENRLKCMMNHTATHLLNAALKKTADAVTCQKSSKVNADFLSFDVATYGKKMSLDDAEKAEQLIKQYIERSITVQIRKINSQELLSFDNITLLPGEIYPDVGIRLVEIDDGICFSREPCCGTHVMNTADIKDICITNFKSLGRSTISLSAVTGKCAIEAHENGKQILKDISDIQNKLNDSSSEMNAIDDILDIKQKLANNSAGNKYILPVYIRMKGWKILNNINKQIRDAERVSLKEFIDLEMKFALESNSDKSNNNIPFIVHFLGCSSIIDDIPLKRATKICSTLPVIVISYSDEIVKARCCVPQSMVNLEFNAEHWLKSTVGKICKSSCSAPKDQDANLVCNMKAKRVNKLKWETVLDESINTAKKFAINHL